MRDSFFERTNLKVAFVAIFISLFLLASSTYIAIKLGAMPWPIIFSIVASAAILRLFGKFTKHELNIAHAASSIGGLVATALVFVIPGIWFLASKGTQISLPSTLSLILMALAGGLLGVSVSVPIRKRLVEKEELPFPSGTAGAKLIQAGFKGGNLIRITLIVALLTAAFALTRDLWFPAGWVLFAFAGTALVIYPMPLAIGVGYILGPKPAFSWFGGSVVGWLIIIPILTLFNFANSTLLVQNLGMGLLLGSGISFIISYVFRSRSKFQLSKKELLENKKQWTFVLFASLFSVCILSFIGVPFFASLLAVIATIVMVYIAARMTGETDINPLEQFGIIVALLCITIFALAKTKLELLPSFLIAGFTSVAAAVAGDSGHDFKVAHILKTDYKKIVRLNYITVIISALAGPFILKLIITAFKSDLFTSVLPAPQAQLVAGSLAGLAFPKVFALGIVLGAILDLIFKKVKVPVLIMPFAIGLFLGIPLGLLLGLGGLVALLVQQRNKSSYEKGVVIAAGIMGGEGIVGFISAIFTVLGFSFQKPLLIVVSLLVLVLLFLEWRKRR